MKEEARKGVLSEMDKLMRSLRQCDTQAQAVDWMTRAYNAMDGATKAIGAMERMLREERSETKGLIFHIPTPKLEVVQSIPPAIAHRPVYGTAASAFQSQRDRSQPYQRPGGETVVYPEFFLHPGLRPTPRPWTREDTRRLEAAAQMGPRRIVRKGQ